MQHLTLSSTTGRFAHHRLDAWHVALEAMLSADRISRRLGRGYGPLADQLRRASQSAYLQVAEGAAKSGAERAQRFRGARAEASGVGDSEPERSEGLA